MAGRWLVIDADLTSAEQTVAFLRTHGVHSGLVQSGRRAFEILRSSIAVDGILCDVALPRFDGFEFCDELRRTMPSSRQPPIFLLAPVVTPDERDLAGRVGARDLLAKPIDARILPLLDEALRAPPALALVVGHVKSPVIVPPPPPAGVIPSEELAHGEPTLAKCTGCARSYELPDEIGSDLQLVFCPNCSASA